MLPKGPIMKVYVLHHLNIICEGNWNMKFIGVYSSHEEACRAVNRLIKQPGFRDCPDVIDLDKEDDYRSGFYIDIYEIDVDKLSKGFSMICR